MDVCKAGRLLEALEMCKMDFQTTSHASKFRTLLQNQGFISHLGCLAPHLGNSFYSFWSTNTQGGTQK
jgi:hypothetical protein